MKLKFKLGIITSIIAAVSGLALACTNSSASTTSSPTTGELPSAPGIFRVTDLAVNPAEVNTGVEVLITAKVTNTGTADTRYKGNVRIENTTKQSLPSYLGSEEVLIASGATQPVSVTTSTNYPGTYKVTWDEVSREVTVAPGEATSSAANTPSGPAPEFTATDVVTGKTISLKDYGGSPVLLNFVNYGCDLSLNEKVSAQLLAIKELTNQCGDFVPISVFCGCCPPDVLRQFARENDLNWPWILDTDYSIAVKYSKYLRRFSYPTLVFIDKDQFIKEVTGSLSLTTLNEKINTIASSEAK